MNDVAVLELHRWLERFEFMTWTFAGASLARWTAFALASIAVFAALRVVRRVLVHRAERLLPTDAPIANLILQLIRATSLAFLLLLSIYAGSLTLELPARLESLAQTVVTVAFLVQAGLWGGRVIAFGIDELVRRRAAADAGLKTATGALGFVARLALWSVVVLMILASLRIDVTALVAGLGIGGIAIALATQNILGDLFASLSIVLDRPFAVGDFIVVDDLAGIVDHVGLKTTRIRALSGEQLVFSNSDLLKSRIRNFKLLLERRIVFGFGVIYSTAYEKLERIPAMVKEIIESTPETRFDRAHFKEYGDSSLNFEVVYFVTRPEFNSYMDAQQRINLALFKRFQAEGIDFAFPTRTLYVNQVSPPGSRGE
jgi:small-conductance mechanosensitive channel